MMAQVDDVLARLEAATEGSEALDRLIYEAMGAEEFFDCTYSDSDMPPFSTSVDAALTLVPDGWGIGLAQEWPWPKEEAPLEARLFHRAHGCVDATHDDPALALCIAALRAREATHD